MTEIGTRVTAIQCVEDGIVKFFGKGTYVGNEAPPLGTITPFGKVDEVFPKDWINPKIILDDGSIVWGCQCWWGPEDVVELQYKDYQWEIVCLPA